VKRAIRWGAGVLGVLLAGVALFAGVVRFGDGPVGVFPGGPLVSGAMIHMPVDDWGFARDVELVELQLMSPLRSRTTWVVVEGERAFIPCGAPGFRLWKQWPHQALADGRALVRIEGSRYPVQLLRVEDEDLARRLRENAQRKYPTSEGVEMEVWFFELTPPEGAREA